MSLGKEENPLRAWKKQENEVFGLEMSIHKVRKSRCGHILERCWGQHELFSFLLTLFELGILCSPWEHRAAAENYNK